MLKIISILPPAKQHKLRQHLNKQRSLLELDVSSYGVGRHRYWLEHEPILGSSGRAYQPAVQNAAFWHFCQTIYQRASRVILPEQGDLKPDVGLVAYGGVGIREHRDDPYAACPTVGINLSTMPTQWGYTANYSGYDKRYPKKASEHIYQLPPGAIVTFNSQNPHRVISPDPERWSIIMWRIAPTCRPYFQRYLDTQPSVDTNAEGNAAERNAAERNADNNAVSFFPQAGEKSYGQNRNKGRASRGPDMDISRANFRRSQR